MTELISNCWCRDCTCGLLFQQAFNYLDVTVSSKDGQPVATVHPSMLSLSLLYGTFT